MEWTLMEGTESMEVHERGERKSICLHTALVKSY